MWGRFANKGLRCCPTNSAALQLDSSSERRGPQRCWSKSAQRFSIGHPNRKVYFAVVVERCASLDSTICVLGDSPLRRLMCNELYEQVRQVAQRSAERVVDPLSAGVGRHLGRQARQKPSQRLGAVALQTEEVLELADDPFYDLALARGPSPIGLRPRPAGVVLGRRSDDRPVDLHHEPLPLYPGETLVGQVGSVAIGGHEGLPYGPLVGCRRSQPEGRDLPVRVYQQSHLEAVYPLGLGSAPPEGCLTAEEALAGSSHPHDGRDEGSVHHVVDGRRLRELLGEGPLQEAQLRLQGSDAPVELTLRTEARKVGTQVRPSEAPEVALAAETGPLGEDGQGKELALGKEGGTARLARHARGVIGLPPIVHEHVQ